MTNQPHQGNDVASRILHSLNTIDDIGCTEAQDQLSALVEAEFAGQRVDAEPTFEQLLHHLDYCENCIALYEQLSKDFALLAEPVDSLSPQVVAEEHIGVGVVLRVFANITRSFELLFALPQIAPSVATLGVGQRVNVFASALPRVEGAPIVSVVLTLAETTALLQVAVQDATMSPWAIDLTVGSTKRYELTDNRGMARFTELPVTELSEITLRSTELRVEP